MNSSKHAVSIVGALLSVSSAALTEPVQFAPEPHRGDTTVIQDSLIHQLVAGRTEGQFGLTFCLQFGDDIAATAMPQGIAGGGALFRGAGGSMSAEAARAAILSWLFGPVPNPGEDAEIGESTVWLVEGGLNAAMLAGGWLSELPDLGDPSRSIGFLRTTDDYRIADGKAVFVPETMRTVTIPLPNAAALAAAGLFVLGARRRT